MVECQAPVTISRQAALAMVLFGKKFLTQSCSPCKLEDLADAAPEPLVMLEFHH